MDPQSFFVKLTLSGAWVLAFLCLASLCFSLLPLAGSAMALPCRVTSDMASKGLAEDIDKHRRGDTWCPGWKPSSASSVGRGRARFPSRNESHQETCIMTPKKEIIAKLSATIATLKVEITALRAQLNSQGKPAPLRPEAKTQDCWKEVTTKKGKPPTKKGDEADGELRLQVMTLKMSKALILNDWGVPSVTPDELVMKDKGIVFVTRKIGEQMFNDAGGRMLSALKGSLAIVTPLSIAPAGTKCREIKVRISKASGRVDFITRWITNLGETVVKPAHERKNAITNATLQIKNETSKIVVMFAKKYMNVQDHEATKVAPEDTFKLWLKKYGLGEVLYRSRPSVKKVNEDEWLEIVLTVTHTKRSTLLNASGRDGIFTRPSEPKVRPMILRVKP